MHNVKTHIVVTNIMNTYRIKQPMRSAVMIQWYRVIVISLLIQELPSLLRVQDI